MESASSQPTIKFGPYVVDLRAGELRKFGAKVRLQEKPLQLLAAIAEQSGQVVTRDELRRRLWPDDTFVDFETGLNTAVSKLRDALSDSADKPRYIETIPRRGYRFVVPVEITTGRTNGHSTATPLGASSPGSTSPVAAAAPAIVNAPLPTWMPAVPEPTTRVAAPAVAENVHRRSAKLAWLCVAATALILLVTVWWLTPVPPPSTSGTFRVSQSGRLDFHVRPATDGARIFYVQHSGDHYDLMQSPAGGGTAQPMDAPFPGSLIWDVSPDGRNYLLTTFRRRGEPGPLWSWPTTGGPPMKLGDIVSGSASYSTDGKQIAYHLGNELLVANADGSDPHAIGAFAPREPDSPVWSPDGTRIRFTLNDPENQTGEIWEVTRDGKNPHPVLPSWQSVPEQCCGVWTPDGRYFIFVETSSRRLFTLREKHDWWRRSALGPFLLTAEATGSWAPLVSRDGTTIYYYGSSPLSDLAIYDVKQQRYSTLLLDARPAMLSVSPDRKRVSYVDMDTAGIWVSGFDGGSPAKIELHDMRAAFPRLSPDGQTLAFTGIPEGKPRNVFLVPVQGGMPKPVISAGRNFADPDWSPDGTRVVMSEELPGSAGHSGSRLVIYNVTDQSIENLPNASDSILPRWSPDGRFIAAVHGDSTAMRLFDTSTQTWSTLTEERNVSYPLWSADGAAIYFQDSLLPGQPVFRYGLKSKKIERVASFESELSSGIRRTTLVALAPDDSPMMAFDRTYADIYGAHLDLP